MSLEDSIEEYMAAMPESKLELIDGRLIVGNGLRGSRYLLWDIVNGYGIAAAVALAPLPLWWEALHAAFQEYGSPNASDPLSIWRSWAEQLCYEPTILPAGPHVDGPHRASREELLLGLCRVAAGGGIGHASGHDIVMKVGENGFTPDVFLLSWQGIAAMKERYCDGRADLVMEVLLPGHETQDRDVKRQHYEKAGIPEYWLIDARQHTTEFLRLSGGRYQPRSLDPDGHYRSPWIPGLAFVPARLWERLDRGFPDPNAAALFEIEQRFPPLEALTRSKDCVDWGDVPFAPRTQLEPQPILFNEFASWCPEAKFEGDGEKIIISGRTGTRNVLGMLLRSQGMIESVQLFHPRRWVEALARVEQAERRDAARKAKWWSLARKAVARLRSKYRFGRMMVIGDLPGPKKLNYWSELTLVVFDPIKESWVEIYRTLSKLGKRIRLDLVEAERATKEEHLAIEETGIDI